METSPDRVPVEIIVVICFQAMCIISKLMLLFLFFVFFGFPFSGPSIRYSL